MMKGISGRHVTRGGISGFVPPFTQKFFNLLGFLRKSPPKIFPYNKFENPPLEKFLATPISGKAHPVSWGQQLRQAWILTKKYDLILNCFSEQIFLPKLNKIFHKLKYSSLTHKKRLKNHQNFFIITSLPTVP